MSFVTIRNQLESMKDAQLKIHSSRDTEEHVIIHNIEKKKIKELELSSLLLLTDGSSYSSQSGIPSTLRCLQPL